jgi:hypothetical protein
MDTCLKAFASLKSCNLVSHLSFVIVPLKIGSTGATMSPFKKTAPVCAPTTLRNCWLPFAIWRSPWFIALAPPRFLQLIALFPIILSRLFPGISRYAHGMRNVYDFPSSTPQAV